MKRFNPNRLTRLNTHVRAGIGQNRKPAQIRGNRRGLFLGTRIAQLILRGNHNAASGHNNSDASGIVSGPGLLKSAIGRQGRAG
jgi:hypothetical protein